MCVHAVVCGSSFVGMGPLRYATLATFKTARACRLLHIGIRCDIDHPLPRPRIPTPTPKHAHSSMHTLATRKGLPCACMEYDAV